MLRPTLSSSGHIRICAEHNLTAHQDLCQTQPHGTSGSVPNTASLHIRICAEHNLTAHQDLCRTQPHAKGSVSTRTKPRGIGMGVTTERNGCLHLAPRMCYRSLRNVQQHVPRHAAPRSPRHQSRKVSAIHTCRLPIDEVN